MKTVFISYSHKDEVWKDRLLPQLNSLEQAGLDITVWQDRKIDAGEKWYPEIEQAMKDAAVSILLISADYLASAFCVKEEVPFLLKRQEQEGMLLIPVLIRKCPWKAHRWLADRQMLPRDGKCVTLDFPGDKADEVFCDVAEKVFEYIEKRCPSLEIARNKSLPGFRGAPERAFVLGSILPAPELKFPQLPADSIDLTRLPETGKALFGRDKELELLDEAWVSGKNASAKHTKVLGFIAQGGVGKSSFVNHWLQDMARENFRYAEKVFGWSFYSQGAQSEGMASADTFINEALSFFGGEEGKKLANSPASAWDKGERLARYVGKKRSLLVLDGMEPLQSPHQFERGKLRDPALETLLKCLARNSAGLCLITTREPLFDLAELPGVVTKDIEQITPEAGRALLRVARVIGTDKDLESLAERFGPHALSVSLLGVYLHEIDSKHGIGPAQSLEHLPGETPLERVLAGVEQLLGESGELEVLRLTGLFDRPIDSGCLNALKAEPHIKGLTERIVKLKNADWERLLACLEKLHLLHISQKGIDAHPLIREYFAKKLSSKNPDGWRAAHRRLYEYLTTNTIDKPNPTLEELQPLYQAVSHGCKAGLQQEVLVMVYRDRILKGTGDFGYYSIKKLGAFGEDLCTVACFFKEPWKKLFPALSEDAQGWLLNQAAYCLRALGRLSEAIDPLRAGLESVLKLQDWINVAIGIRNLSQIELSLGDIETAVQDGRKSVEFADRSKEAFEQIAERSTLAGALHLFGKAEEALTLFGEAETMQAERQPKYPLLNSLGGFRYCDLLLAKPERSAWQERKNRASGITYLEIRSLEHVITDCQKVEKRSKETLRWWQKMFKNSSLYSTALEHLTLGRADLYLSIIDPSDSAHRLSAIDNINTAVNQFLVAGVQEYLLFGLLTRAWLRFIENDPSGSRADLDEAQQIAERGSMKLHLADVHLYRGRLFNDKEEIKKARDLIEKCGYWRRKGELEDAEAELGLCGFVKGIDTSIDRENDRV